MSSSSIINSVKHSLSYFSSQKSDPGTAFSKPGVKDLLSAFVIIPESDDPGNTMDTYCILFIRKGMFFLKRTSLLKI